MTGALASVMWIVTAYSCPKFTDTFTVPKADALPDTGPTRPVPIPFFLKGASFSRLPLPLTLEHRRPLGSEMLGWEERLPIRWDAVTAASLKVEQGLLVSAASISGL